MGLIVGSNHFAQAFHLFIQRVCMRPVVLVVVFITRVRSHARALLLQTMGLFMLSCASGRCLSVHSIPSRDRSPLHTREASRQEKDNVALQQQEVGILSLQFLRECPFRF